MKEKLSTTKLAWTLGMMLAPSILCWGNNTQELLGLPNLPRCQFGTMDWEPQTYSCSNKGYNDRCVQTLILKYIYLWLQNTENNLSNSRALFNGSWHTQMLKCDTATESRGAELFDLGKYWSCVKAVILSIWESAGETFAIPKSRIQGQRF